MAIFGPTRLQILRSPIFCIDCVVIQMLGIPVLFWKQKGGGMSAEGCVCVVCGCGPGVGRGVPLLWGRSLGRGLCPLPRKKITFVAQNR